ncbi:Conserved domain protein [Acinetobacter baumannii]
MSYYHILIEVNDHISTIEQTRDTELFDIIELKPYLHSILLPFFNEQEIELEDENIEYKDILHLEVKQTLLPIEHLIEEEQKQLPSDTDVTITAYEIFNDRDLSQDVTSVIFDILEAVKLDQSIV